MRTSLFFGLLGLSVGLASCGPIGGIVSRNAAQSFTEERHLPARLTDPVRPDAGLAALWVGHATVLLQIDDRFVLTDPVFTANVGLFSRRLVEPGIDPANLPRLSAVLISHMHFDHLSLESLSMIEGKVGRLVMPRDGARYAPGYSFPVEELPTWSSIEVDGLRLTAVPVNHVGWRYGADRAWMESFTGYVIEYHGKTVYFGGDTAYAPGLFQATRARFPSIDLALLPIAPIEPRGFMSRTHTSADEAVASFLDLGARVMMPIHYDTFINSIDEPGDALRSLEAARVARSLAPDRVAVVSFGEQRVFLPR
jgi:L-ascorbate metabolism protein UlaG (beta-lactamase superfamily)